MLSGVHHSPQALAANREIMRAFVRLRAVLASHADSAKRIDQLEAKLGRHEVEHEHHVHAIFAAIRTLILDENEDARPRKIGFEVES